MIIALLNQDVLNHIRHIRPYGKRIVLCAPMLYVNYVVKKFVK